MLSPDFYCESVFQIPYEKLLAGGIRGLIYDIDNTLAGYDEERPSPRVEALVERLREMGFQVGLLSNNTEARVNAYNAPLRLPGAHRSAKPLRAALRKVMGEMKVSPGETALIGDQLFTDVWCGKRAGLVTVLVKPLTEKDVLQVKLKRLPERWLLRRYLKKVNGGGLDGNK